MNQRRVPQHSSTEGPTGYEPSEEAMCWCEPFERLSVGQRFRSGRRAVCDTDVMVFSALTGDWHPQHCDADWAAASPFGERIAHGMLILSLAAGLVPFDPEFVIALRRVGEVVFKRPVRLGDGISVFCEITRLTPVDDLAGLVDFGWAVRNDEEAIVCRATVAVLWRRARSAGREEATAFWHDPVTADTEPGKFVPVPL
jgi:3-hydroxybutyryl-CoA dehydratase